MEINGTEYKINTDVLLETRIMMNRMAQDPLSLEKYMFKVLRDMLRPVPSDKEMLKFRESDIQAIFREFTEQISEIDSDFKKKLST